MLALPTLDLRCPSDQQGNLDTYMNTGSGLMDIYVHPQIDCPEYRDVLRSLHKQRLLMVALDMPRAMYNKEISRNEWMAKTVAAEIARNPDTKMLVVVGNFHVLKKIVWQDHVPNPHRSIREYLLEKRRNLRIFPIGQIIGDSVYECDFRLKFGGMDGAVAIDLDERFAGWKMGIVESLAIKPAEVWELLDGVIVY